MGPTVDTTTELVGHDTTDATGTTNVLPLSKFLEIVYSEEIKIWIKDTKIFKAILYNIVWGQCSKLTWKKIIIVGNFSNIQLKCDVTELLKSIRGISNQIEINTSVYDVLDEAKRLYYVYRQGNDETK